MEINKDKNYIEQGIDAPLENPKEDCLDRALFAKRIFKLIEGTPTSSNITIGIHGSWGSGKTTVLNFIKYYCKESGHPFVIFNPWQFRNREEAWWGFVSSIDKGIAIWQKKKIKIGTLGRQKFVKKASEKVRELTAITTVGKVAGNLILAPLEGLLEQNKQRVQEELDKTLKDKRLFVFIDDLDRTEPDVLYEVLMLLNEVVDLKRCIYIIGLDVAMASQVIENKVGFKSSKEFLNKIINWPFKLPEPTDYEWRELLDKEIEKLDKNIKKDVIQSILSYLFKNPRKIKLFLGYLSGLHKSFLERYDDYELDWKILYLAQLLRFEFPIFFEKMVNEKELIKDLAFGIFTDRFAEREQRILSGINVPEKEEEPKWKKIINSIGKDLDISESAKNHILILYEAIRNSEVILSEQHLKNHLLVIEAPELFTWKEYYAFKEKILSIPENERIKEIEMFINSSKKQKELERVREFLRAFMRDREQLLSKESDMHVREEMDPLLNGAMNITEMCSLLLDIDDIFEGKNPIFNKDIFKEWYASLGKWAHFKTDQRYLPIRNLETEIAKKLASKISNQASSILEIVYRADYESSFSPHEFRGSHQEVKKILEEALSQQLIDRFSSIDGIEEIFNKNLTSEKSMLFKKHPSFYNAETYKKLRELSKQADKDLYIYKNFYFYVRFLFYCAKQGCTEIRLEEAKELLKDKELIDIVWKAATSRSLNLRSIGDLEKKRKFIKSEILQDETALPVPKWWEELLCKVDKDETTDND